MKKYDSCEAYVLDELLSLKEKIYNLEQANEAKSASLKECLDKIALYEQFIRGYASYGSDTDYIHFESLSANIKADAQLYKIFAEILGKKEE